METVTIKANALMFGITKNARLYKINEKEIWVPNSVCQFEKSINQGDPIAGNGDIKGELTVKTWFYDKHFK
jgi:hypothetical protein